MDEGSTPTPKQAPMAPRLGRPGDPVPTRSGRQIVIVFGSMTILFVVLVALAIWGANNG